MNEALLKYMKGWIKIEGLLDNKIKKQGKNCNECSLNGFNCGIKEWFHENNLFCFTTTNPCSYWL